MKLTNFIKRNMPIFSIGLLTMFVFVGIIIAGERQGATKTALKIVNESELIADHNYTKGPQSSAVVLVEFSDFECPACAAFQSVLKGLELEYPNLKLVFKHFPLPQHTFGKKAAYASMAAGEQDAFWEYHDLLFQNQNDLNDETFETLAKELGLDIKKFNDDYKSARIKALVEADIKTGQSLNVNSTPTFFLNGKMLELNQIDDLRRLIAEEMKAQTKTDTKPQTTKPNQGASKVPGKRDSDRESLINDFGDKVLGPEYEIILTTEGFSPQEAEMALGQTVVFVNNTDKAVLIKPVAKNEVYPELKDGIAIEAKGRATFKPYKTDRFDYVEETLTLFGYILPIDISEE